MTGSTARAQAKAEPEPRTAAAPASPAAYLASLPEPRRSEIARIDAIIRAAVPGLAPCVTAGMLGYGPFHYRTASGREGDTARIALSSRARSISLHVCAADARGSLAERYRARLPRADVGKGCVRFERLDDLDRAALEDLLREAEGMGWGDQAGAGGATLAAPT